MAEMTRRGVFEASFVPSSLGDGTHSLFLQLSSLLGATGEDSSGLPLASRKPLISSLLPERKERILNPVSLSRD